MILKNNLYKWLVFSAVSINQFLGAVICIQGWVRVTKPAGP
jgi:hypothetical protein